MNRRVAKKIMQEIDRYHQGCRPVNRKGRYRYFKNTRERRIESPRDMYSCQQEYEAYRVFWRPINRGLNVMVPWRPIGWAP